MISIVISEKGGGERHELYHQNEITVGRVKGNDLLLPKGNVSKRHARLIMRDGRYIVTDLKSTNGTYVNHRRITHATLVREGDRIYIGDFVLRIDTGSSQDGGRAPASPSFESSDSSASYRAYSHGASGPATPDSARPAEPTQAPGPNDEIVSHFPIEHDPDDSAPALAVPGPPRVPTGFRQGGSGPYAPGGAETPHGGQRLTRSSGVGALARPQLSSEPLTPSVARGSAPAPDEEGRAGRQTALDALVRAVEQQVGVDLLAAVAPDEGLSARVGAALDEQLAKAGRESGSSAGPDPVALRNAAHRDLLELGPLGPLLEQESVTLVRVTQRQVVAHRRGRGARRAEVGFATDAGVKRAIGRLVHRAGAQWPEGASQLNAALPDGRQLFAVLPPLAIDGPLLTVRTRAPEHTSLDSLVRSGTISRGMAILLAQCVRMRANILVVGPSGSGARSVLDALSRAGSRRATALWLQHPEDADDLPDGVARISLAGDAAARLTALRAAASLSSDHLLCPGLRGEELVGLLDCVAGGTTGVMMHVPLTTLPHALDQLGVELAGARSGLSPESAREWIGSAFDLGLEVSRLSDGRLRALRLAELRSGSRAATISDIFQFAFHRTAAGGSIEGSFYASGTVPHIAEQLAARGMPVDTAIFRRHPSS